MNSVLCLLFFFQLFVSSVFTASWQPRLVCSSLLEVCGQAALWWQHATWTKTPWVICSGAGAPTVPWQPVWSETQRAVTLLSLCRYIQRADSQIYSDWLKLHTTYILRDVLNNFSSVPTSPSWGCLTPTWWWVTITSSRMMTRQKLKALLSRFSSYPIFNSTGCNFAPEGILFVVILEPLRLFCFLAVPGLAGLVLSWNMEQRGRSADTVSCQPLSASVSRRESPSKSSTVYWSTYNSNSNAILHVSTIYGCSLFFSQLRLARASQNYLFPIHLTDQLLPSAMFYATVGPLLAYMAIHRLIVIPYTKAQKEESASFLFYPNLLWCTNSILVHHSSRKLQSDNFIENPLRTWASSLCAYLLPRELELQRKSSATDIAKKKQEAESAVSTGTRKQAVTRCVCGIIDHCLWVPLSSLYQKKMYSFFALFHLILIPSPLAPLQVLLMQESVRRIIEVEESKMGERTHTHRQRLKTFFLVCTINQNLVKKNPSM